MTSEKKTIDLKAGMIAWAGAFLEKVPPTKVDVEILSKYDSMLPKDGIIDAFNAGKYATKALEAMSIAKLYAKVCKAFYLAAKKNVQKQEAMVYYDAEKRLEEMGQPKGRGGMYTDTAKKMLVDQSDEVQGAKDVRNSWEVLASYFETSMFEYKDRHYWFKTIFEKDVRTGDTIEQA